MDALGKEGRYTVRHEILDAITKDFDAGFASDAETKESIREVYEKSRYLMDTHTATAWTILKKMRDAGEYTGPAIIVSTASPFKFSENVMTALRPDLPSMNLSTEDLARYTGQSVPAPLKNLEERQIRFEESVERSGMKDAVSRFLA